MKNHSIIFCFMFFIAYGCTTSTQLSKISEIKSSSISKKNKTVVNMSHIDCNTESDCLKKGNKCFEFEDYNQAIKYYSKGIILCDKKNSKNLINLYVKRGSSYYELKQKRKAFDDYEYALDKCEEEGLTGFTKEDIESVEGIMPICSDSKRADILAQEFNPKKIFFHPKCFCMTDWNILLKTFNESDKWLLIDSFPNKNPEKTKLFLNSNGELMHRGIKHSKGSWQLKNGVIKFTINKYSFYEGLFNKNKMAGEAYNKKGEKWTWEAIKQ